jgi:FkbM family methyltransferase
VPRYTTFSTDLLGVPIKGVDSASFVSSYGEIFQREIYRFTTGNAAPTIIDCGANIGLSVIYFKRLYPAARIIAFEADPGVYDVLAANVRALGLSDVALHNNAVWKEETVLDFFSEGADAGRLGSTSTFSGKTKKVHAVRLREYLRQAPVDLLKIDIEGAETAVLRDCADSLANVQRLFVEYHSFEDRPQELHELLTLLHDAGFRIYATPIGHSAPQPFERRDTYLGMDMQFNVFAARDWVTP